jgi:hypothetical protein
VSAGTEQRFQQSRHGFVKLSAIFRDTSGWRIVRTGEVPTAIVSRVYGLDTFAAVSSNELDGLEDIVVGGRYGPNPSGVLTIDVTPAYAVGVTPRSVFINLSGQSASGAATVPVDLSIYQLTSEKGQPGGYAPLAIDGRVYPEDIPLPTDAVLTYNLDGTLATLTDTNGSKTFSYSLGKLVTITGTGIYPNKSFIYTGDQLTSIEVN